MAEALEELWLCLTDRRDNRMEQFKIPKKMKAMTLTAYDKLQLAEVDVPQPGPGEVLCRIKSVAICGSDPKMIPWRLSFC